MLLILTCICLVSVALSFYRDFSLKIDFRRRSRSAIHYYKPNDNKINKLIVFDSYWVQPVPYKNLTVGIPKEKNYGEKRVSQTPRTISFLKEKGFNVVVEKGAGTYAGFNDSQYESYGATLVNRHTAWNADIVLKVQPPSNDEARLLGSRTLISFMHHALHKDTISILANQNSTVMSMNMLPSQYRGLSFDAITSQARICGYQAFTESFLELSKGNNLSIKNNQNQVLIIGGGEAGISALKEAKKKGMIVSLYDRNLVNQKKVELAGGYFVKPAVLKKNETFEDAERELLSSVLAKFDLVISTMVMGDQTTSPTLVTSAMLQTMRKGSVVFDMAASLRGGNVQQSRPNEVVVTSNGVKVIGFTDLPSRAAGLASAAYANNIAEFLLSIGHNSRFNKDDVFYPSSSDPVVRAMLVVDQGKLMNNHVFKKPVFKVFRNKIKHDVSIETSKLAIPISRSNANNTISAIASTLKINLPTSSSSSSSTIPVNNTTTNSRASQFASFFKSYFSSKPSDSYASNDDMSISDMIKYLLGDSASQRDLFIDEAVIAGDILVRRGIRKSITLPVVKESMNRIPIINDILKSSLTTVKIPFLIPNKHQQNQFVPIFVTVNEFINQLAPNLTEEEELYATSLTDLTTYYFGKDLGSLVNGSWVEDPLAAVRVVYDVSASNVKGIPFLEDVNPEDLNNLSSILNNIINNSKNYNNESNRKDLDDVLKGLETLTDKESSVLRATVTEVFERIRDKGIDRLETFIKN